MDAGEAGRSLVCHQPPAGPEKQLIRELEKDDLKAAEDVQRRTWGCSDLEVVPLHLLLAHRHNGGCLLGAFDHEQLIGLAYAFPGKPGSLYSHVVGVLPSHQNQGIGRKLKLKQREWAARHGFERINWTFDPMQARNAHLNLTRLGARASRYYVDYYGDLDDDLNRGLPSDRLEVDWSVGDLPSGQVAHRIEFAWPSPERLQTRLQLREQLQEAFSQGMELCGCELFPNEQRAVYLLCTK